MGFSGYVGRSFLDKNGHMDDNIALYMGETSYGKILHCLFVVKIII